MSKLVATFDNESAAHRALASVEQYNYANGQVIGNVSDSSLAVDSNLVLSGRETSRTLAAAAVGAVIGVVLMYLHRVGTIAFPLLTPIFSGGAYPAYFAGGAIGAIIGAFLSSLGAMTEPHLTVGPTPSVLLLYCARKDIPACRNAVEKYGGMIV